MFCTTELCLSVGRLKEDNKHKQETMLVSRGNVVVCILSTVKTESTPARLEAFV